MRPRPLSNIREITGPREYDAPMGVPAAPRLHGRDDESAALDRVLARVGDGDPAVLAIAGDPGIGKTALLAELVHRGERAGHRVLLGVGTEFEQDRAYGVVADALNPHADAAQHLAGADATALGAVLPSLEAPATPPTREAVLRALVRLLELLAPVVLCIDDLQWADSSSMALMLQLLRRPPQAPVLLAVTYRPAALADHAGVAQAALVTRAADELVEPGPLDRDAAGALLGGAVSDARLDALMTETGGNPFYLEQLARSTGEAVAHAPSRAGVPAAIAASLAQELAALAPDARAVCDVAAVVGDPVDHRLVATAAGRTDDDTLSALDALVRSGILEPLGTVGRFRFRHPIVRRSAYEATDSATRLRTHRLLADALEARGAPPADRAHHLAAAATPGDAAAIATLVAAGHELSHRSPVIAARWFSAALALMPVSADPAERVGVLGALAAAQAAAGRLEDGRGTLLEVLNTLPPSHAALRGRVVGPLALIGHMLGHHGEATQLLRRALDDVDDPEGVEAAELGIAATSDCLYEPAFGEMPALAAAADRAAARTSDVVLQAAGAGARALAAYNTGDPQSSLEQSDRAIALLARATDGEIAARMDAVLPIAWTAMALEQHELCIAVCDRALEISAATGQSQLLVPLTIARAVARTWRGELTEAAGEADALLDAVRLSGIDQSLAWALTLRGWIATLAGELTLAADCGEEAVAINAARGRPTYFVAHARVHLAETWLERGDAGVVRATILDADGGPELPVCEAPMRPRNYELLTRAALAAGDLADARSWALRAARAAAGSPLGGRRCEAGLAQAAVALAEDDLTGAARLARHATADAVGAGDRILAARGQLLLGQALASSDRGAALGAYETARAELDHCGAVRLRDVAVRGMRGLGRRVGSGGARAAGPGALSRREAEVAELVAIGLTNRQIAERLVLSDRTIETHVAALFRKLDVRGRAAIGAALAREGGGNG